MAVGRYITYLLPFSTEDDGGNSYLVDTRFQIQIS